MQCARTRANFINSWTLDNVLKILQGFSSVSLQELDSVALLDRHDTKYLLRRSDLEFILTRLQEHYAVLDVNGFRASPYETQYFDTEDLLYFNLHQRGKRNRLKVRIRKYCSTGVTFLEVKFKTNTDRTIKYRKPIEDIRDCLLPEDLQFISINNGVQPPLSARVFNAFDRITLADIRSGERLTIDFNLRFADEKGLTKVLDHLVIVELKQIHFDRESVFARLAKGLFIRPDSVSKYCLGIGLLEEGAKKNNINVKLRRIRKLETIHRP